MASPDQTCFANAAANLAASPGSGSQGGGVIGGRIYAPGDILYSLSAGYDFTGKAVAVDGEGRNTIIGGSGPFTLFTLGANASNLGSGSRFRDASIIDNSNGNPNSSEVALQVGGANSTDNWLVSGSYLNGNQTWNASMKGVGVLLKSAVKGDCFASEMNGWQYAMEMSVTSGQSLDNANAIVGCKFRGSVEGIHIDSGAVGDTFLFGNTLEGNNIGLNNLGGGTTYGFGNHYENAQGTSPYNIQLASGASHIGFGEAHANTNDVNLSGGGKAFFFGSALTTINNTGTGAAAMIFPVSFNMPTGSGTTYNFGANANQCYSSGGLGNGGTTGGGQSASGCLSSIFSWQGWGRYSVDNVFRLWTTSSDPGNGPLEGDFYYRSDVHRPAWYNNGGQLVAQFVASGTASMTTAAIAAGTCGTTVTVAATGVQTTDTITISSNAAVTTPNGLLIINYWPTANNVNFNYCNPTASSQTPTANTVNWRVIR